MTCEPLAFTGSGIQIGLLVTVAILCVVAGGVTLLMTRRRGRAVTLTILVMLCGAGMSITTTSPAQADGVPDCPPAHNSLTVIQTSVMQGLAPGSTPLAIAGTVSNNGTDSTDILAVKVEIVGVVDDLGSAPGSCEMNDYYLLDPLMPVGRTLAPGGSTTFSGASIGLRNTPTNQDSCQGATIELLYTANPT